MIIAIDGLAASGKSTTAKQVARELGFTYLDTGAMYRAVTLAVLERNLDLKDEAGLRALLSELSLELKYDHNEQRIILNGRDVSRAIRSRKVTSRVSAVSALPIVREAMVKIQRELAAKADCVVEGRDIGTVVFPDAELKFFIVADYATRAQRRQSDLQQLGEEQALETLMEDLKKRDEWDATRAHSPLKKATDAIVIDTSNLTVEEQVAVVVEHYNHYLEKRKGK
jgi:cytidylate kinase